MLTLIGTWMCVTVANWENYVLCNAMLRHEKWKGSINFSSLVWLTFLLAEAEMGHWHSVKSGLASFVAHRSS